MCGGECGGALTCLPGTYGPGDPGGGPYDPQYEIRWWYRDPDLAPSAVKEHRIEASWADIFGHWRLIELDLQDWGHDVESGLLDQRTWRWLQLRIHGLLSSPSSRLHRALKPPPKQEVPRGLQRSA